MIRIRGGESVHTTQLKTRKLKAQMLLTCCRLLVSCRFVYSQGTRRNVKEARYFCAIAQQLSTWPWRAPHNLFPQKAARSFTRSCTRLIARESCCRMACDCLYGGEWPAPAKHTTPTRHPRNDTFCTGKPNILRRVNVRVNVCYLKEVLFL